MSTAGLLYSHVHSVYHFSHLRWLPYMKHEKRIQAEFVGIELKKANLNRYNEFN